MNRREFLHRAGASATAAGVAGCLGSAALDSSAPNDSNPDDAADCETSAKSSADDFAGIESDADEPFREISVGNRDDVAFPESNRPRTIRVWNAADGTRTIDFRVARGDDRPVDEAIEFPPDAYLTATLAEPADYSVSVAVSSDAAGTDATGADATGADDATDDCDAVSTGDSNAGSSASGSTTGDASARGVAFPVPRSAFDCNHAAVDVGVMADGRIETMEGATAMGCPGPRVRDSALSVEQANCGTENRASVAFDRERVRVDGAVRTPTPQWTLELAAVEYDADADSLAVRVRAVESETGDVGVQCVGEVPYEATVGFENALPGEVSVVHETNEGTVEVARTSRPADD